MAKMPKLSVVNGSVVELISPNEAHKHLSHFDPEKEVERDEYIRAAQQEHKSKVFSTVDAYTQALLDERRRKLKKYPLLRFIFWIRNIFSRWFQ